MHALALSGPLLSSLGWSVFVLTPPRALRAAWRRVCARVSHASFSSLSVAIWDLATVPAKRTLLQNPLRVLIYERYVDKHAYLEVHRTSAQFLQFRPALAALSPKIDGHSYFECPEGY